MIHATGEIVEDDTFRFSTPVPTGVHRIRIAITHMLLCHREFPYVCDQAWFLSTLRGNQFDVTVGKHMEFNMVQQRQLAGLKIFLANWKARKNTYPKLLLTISSMRAELCSSRFWCAW